MENLSEISIYDKCPTYFSSTLTIRALSEFDAPGLLAVYSDADALPFFNSDNCHGDDFHYTTLSEMQKTLAAWQRAYQDKQFVRFAVTDNITSEIVGTLEMFDRGALTPPELAGDIAADSTEAALSHGILRIDLRSSYERADVIRELLTVAENSFYSAFGVRNILTKAIPSAQQRIKALTAAGYRPFAGKLGGVYTDYYIRAKM